jgi:hypothetical protein
MDEIDFSYQPVLKKAPISGYALSPYPERSRTFDVQELNLASIAQYLIDNAEMWGSKKHYLGGWLDRATGKFYLDVSIVVQDRSEAERLTRMHKERAYFDIAKRKTVYVTSVAAHENRVIEKSLEHSWYRRHDATGATCRRLRQPGYAIGLQADRMRKSGIRLRRS